MAARTATPSLGELVTHLAELGLDLVEVIDQHAAHVQTEAEQNGQSRIAAARVRAVKRYGRMLEQLPVEDGA